jgi:hypothetical protein
LLVLVVVLCTSPAGRAIIIIIILLDRQHLKDDVLALRTLPGPSS